MVSERFLFNSSSGCYVNVLPERTGLHNSDRRNWAGLIFLLQGKKKWEGISGIIF